MRGSTPSGFSCCLDAQSPDVLLSMRGCVRDAAPTPAQATIAGFFIIQRVVSQLGTKGVSHGMGRVTPLTGHPRFVVSALAAMLALLLPSAGAFAAQPSGPAGMQAVLEHGNPASGLPSLPAAPSAKHSTIFGGAIRHIDPVRDEFLLDIYGERPMKVLFDERTQVFRNGARIPVSELAAADHASVQTALDGTSIFAISVHILSAVPEGEYQGRILRFDESSGKLQFSAAPSPRPFTVFVSPHAPIVREGQTAFTAQGSGRWDLQPGSLVKVTFTPGGNGRAVATRIVVLAVPGSSFVFTGSISDLNVASGSLVIADPSDQKSYRISFVPSAIAGSGNLRIGEQVRIAAEYNGTAYVATSIASY